MLERLDDWMIDKCECFSHLTQTRFGLGSATWERWSLVLCVYYYISKELPAAGSTPRLAVVGFIGISIVERFIVSFLRKPRNRADSEATVNPVRLESRSVRVFIAIVGVAFVPFDVIENRFWYEFFVASLYFAACDDLPPGKSWLKEKITAMMVALRRRPSLVGQS